MTTPAPPRYVTSPTPVPSIPKPAHYGNVIIAEFMGCVLLTVLTPWAKQRHVARLSPYTGAEVVRLASILLLYFLLAAVATASPGAARVCAWLGGLVLIADGLYEANNLAGDFGLFTGTLAKLSGASTGSTTAAGSGGGSNAGTGGGPAHYVGGS